MKYRTFKKGKMEISQLGFGTMRLPVMGSNPGEVDEEKAVSMIRSGIDQGVNYIDTAYMYHGGKSEEVVGKALKDGYRERVFLADKMPVWMADEPSDMQRIFVDQLKKMQTDYFDFYLAHNMNRAFWEKAKKFRLMEFLREKQEEGRIKYIGFSFHDELDLFKEILDAFDWDFCQIQLNFMDRDFQAGVSGLEYAGRKGIPVVVMEPIKGGKLTENIPESIQVIWQEAPIRRKPADWALRWVANFPQVMTILSGMSEPSHVNENVRVLSEAVDGGLSANEIQIINKVSDEYNRLIRASCTNCQYCLPCPMHINIPSAISYLNNWYIYEKNLKVVSEFEFDHAEHLPSSCISCRACEKKCPQQLPITELMKEMVEVFENPASDED